MGVMAPEMGIRETRIPARLDRLPFTRWHWLVLVALGITWLLDGLEVTVIGSVSDVLTDKATLALTKPEVTAAGTAYLAGAVLGALVFGYLTDRLGRRKLFMITLGLYLVGTVLTAFSFNVVSFLAFRFLTGMGIGGEYSAINSAIDELIPARVRGHADLAINSIWWLGTACGALGVFGLLNSKIVSVNIAWRLAFAFGAVLGIGILLVRRFLPESPRWLMTHGRMDEAEQIVGEIEEANMRHLGLSRLSQPEGTIKIRERHAIGFGLIARVMFRQYPRRTVLGLSLMIAQAVLYNAIFFTYAIVLATYYKVPATQAPLYLVAFAVGNLFGPILLGRLFDSVGRRPMISGTYIVSGLILAGTAWAFQMGYLNATTQTLLWCVMFFIASASASAAYLTVSEVFPLELRAMAISFFYALGSAPAIATPYLVGTLINPSSKTALSLAYLVGAALMVTAGVVEVFLGVKAERQSLEKVAAPLSIQDDEQPSRGPRARLAPG
jgi:MFS family permease